MNKKSVLQTRINEDDKIKFSSVARNKGMTDSAYLRYLIQVDIKRQEGEKNGK